MCGHLAQSQAREDCLALLAEDIERDIPYGPGPIGRYNVAPGTEVPLLSERGEHLRLDPVPQGCTPGRWDKPPLINAYVEATATSRMSRLLWQHDRAVCFAGGWFEWRKESDKKQPYFIYCTDGQPAFMAAIGSTPFERGDEAEGFLAVTTVADRGLVDIHDHRLLVLSPETVWEWVRQDIDGKEASEVAVSGCVPASRLSWHPVSHAVDNIKDQGAELIQPV